MVGEGIHDFVIEEFEQFRAGVDEVDFNSEVAKHGGVFAADDTGSIDRDRLRFLF